MALLENIYGIVIWIGIICCAYAVTTCVRGREPAPVRMASAAVSPEAPRPRMPERDLPVSYMATAVETPLRHGEGFDLVAHPELTLDAFNWAASGTNVHPEILGGLWMIESGEVYGDRGGAGGYKGQEVLAMDQYRIRDRWLGQKKVSVLDAPKGGECGYLIPLLGSDPSDVKRIKQEVGNGTRNAWALCLIAKRHGFAAETLWASRGRATMDVRESNYGGCIGPAQITPIEWIDQGRLDLNPLVFADAMRGVALRLDREYRKFLAEVGDPGRAMQMAISGYAGSDTDQKYYAHKLEKIKLWRKLESEGTLRGYLTDKARKAGAKWRTGGKYYATR